MAGFEIKIDLDDLTGGLIKVKQLKVLIQSGVDDGMEELLSLMIAKLRENLTKYGLGDSSFMNKIVGTLHGDGIEIDVDSTYLMYVEYGTGIVGSQSPHPEPIPYDLNNHGDKGWVYQDTGGDFYWTKGQPAKPFMYETYLYGKSIVKPVIEKNIEKALGRL